jgi:GNAT superfamily N-acetyltransferase
VSDPLASPRADEINERSESVKRGVTGGYTITDDPAAIDGDRLFEWLSTDAYWWSGGITRAILEGAVANSLCFSALSSAGEFVGFGRMITDRATFAFWSDVYVSPVHRGRGLGSELTRAALDHCELSNCRRIVLVTRDAQGVYEGVGFSPLEDPSIYMEVTRPWTASFTTSERRGTGSPAASR